MRNKVTYLPLLTCLVCVCGLSSVRCGGTPTTSDNTNDNSSDQVTNVRQITYFLSPSRQIVSIIDPTGFEELLDISETETRSAIEPWIQAYVANFGGRFESDEVDYIIFLLDEHREELRFNALGGFNVTVSASESGIGSFVSSTVFEAFPSLRSYIYLARKDSIVLGPSLHELAHSWGVRLSDPSVLGTQATDSNGHWGYSSVGGQMGGWTPGTLQDLGGGAFELSSGNVEATGRPFNTVPYAPLEMYLMGLVGEESVEPIEVAINPQFISLFQFSADGISTVTIDDIIAANGDRIPDVRDSQRTFNIILLVLTDHEFDDDEWQFYQDSIDFLAADESLDILDAFDRDIYNGEPIETLIRAADPEDSTREFINFFDATEGRADIEFMTLPLTVNSVGQVSTDGLAVIGDSPVIADCCIRATSPLHK